MCGIVGYAGDRQAAGILVDGLEKLEYRGYDSAGIAVFENGHICVEKAKGRLSNLEEKLRRDGVPVGNVGIGHTRWATHGEPSDINSHPHTHGRVTLVHNGIIENYLSLKHSLEAMGNVFTSETDTEVIAHLIDYYYSGDPMDAIVRAVGRLEGSYALGVLFSDIPDRLFAVRKDSPLIVGVGSDGNFIASDVPAILAHTRKYYLIDQQIKHDAYEESLCQPHHVLWRFLVDLGEGVVQSIAIPADYLWKKMLTPNMMTGKNFHELIPSENAVAYNAMARLFERAKPVKKIRYSNGNICYVYRRDGKLQAAIWNYQKKKGISADFSGFSSMTDLFGNPEKPGVKPLGNAPYYLFQGTLSEKEFLRKLENLPIQLEQPVSCGEIARLAGSTLLVMLHNDSEQEQSGVAGITGGGLSARKMMKFSIAPRRSLSLEIPVKEVKSNGKQTELMLQLKGSVFRLPLTVVRNKTIGKTFEMERAKGEIRIEKNSIVLSMTVRDTSDSGPAGTRNPWETDCVELFFDTAPQNIPARHAQAYTDKTFRLFITPRDKQKLHALGAVKPEMCRLQTSLNKNGYSFTLTIPVSVGKILGFDVKIDDSNGKTIQEFTLGSGEKLFQNRCNFSLFLQK